MPNVSQSILRDAFLDSTSAHKIEQGEWNFVVFVVVVIASKHMPLISIVFV